MVQTLHFVGFRGDQYNSAVRVFGRPDFIHRIWDKRAWAESRDETAVVVFARPKDWENLENPAEHTFDDSAVM